MKRGVQNIRHLRSLRPCRGTVSGVSDRYRKAEKGYHPRKEADTGRLWATVSNIGEKFGFLHFSVLKFWDIFVRNARGEQQAGERVGAVNGPRPDSQRPEIPTARRFFGFGNGLQYGAVMKPLAPIYGAKTPVLLRKTRCRHRRIAIKMLKERDIMKNSKNVRILPLCEATDQYDPGGGMGFRLNA